MTRQLFKQYVRTCFRFSEIFRGKGRTGISAAINARVQYLVDSDQSASVEEEIRRFHIELSQILDLFSIDIEIEVQDFNKDYRELIDWRRQYSFRHMRDYNKYWRI